jgi:hypothetical protein
MIRTAAATSRYGRLHTTPRLKYRGNQSSDLLAPNADRGTAPERVADAVLQAMAQGRSESVIGWPERFFTRLNGVFPSLVDGALIKQLPVIRRFTQGDLRS